MSNRTTPRIRLHAHASGFTLIELMITLAIMVILAAIALTKYHDYANRARLTAMVSEISAGKVGMEMLLMDGPLSAIIPPEEVGLQPSTELCTTVTAVAWLENPVARLTCVSKYSEVQLWYSTTDGWACHAFTWIPDWAPADCESWGWGRPDP